MVVEAQSSSTRGQVPRPGDRVVALTKFVQVIEVHLEGLSGFLTCFRDEHARADCGAELTDSGLQERRMSTDSLHDVNLFSLSRSSFNSLSSVAVSCALDMFVLLRRGRGAGVSVTD